MSVSSRQFFFFFFAWENLQKKKKSWKSGAARAAPAAPRATALLFEQPLLFGMLDFFHSAFVSVLLNESALRIAKKLFLKKMISPPYSHGPGHLLNKKKPQTCLPFWQTNAWALPHPWLSHFGDDAPAQITAHFWSLRSGWPVAQFLYANVWFDPQVHCFGWWASVFACNWIQMSSLSPQFIPWTKLLSDFERITPSWPPICLQAALDDCHDMYWSTWSL